MSATAKTWVNGLAPTCEDDDLNGFKNENNNLIIGSGQGLSTADNQQTHKAVAHYAGVGDYYVDSGIANAYVLSVTGVQVAPPTYATGLRFRFVPGNSNTGASTVNLAGLGVKNLIDDITGAALLAGSLPAGSQAEAYYDGTDCRLVSSFKPSLVLLNTPVSLVSSSTQSGGWTTLDMSVAYATAATAGASVAILRCRCSYDATGLGYSELLVQKNGLGGSASGARTVAYAPAASSGESASDTNDVTVPLDANSDFEYWSAVANGTGAWVIYLVGYYA